VGRGGTADVTVRGSDGSTVLTSNVTIAADGGFAVPVPESGGSSRLGDYSIRVRAKGGAGAHDRQRRARHRRGRRLQAMGDAIGVARRPRPGRLLPDGRTRAPAARIAWRFELRSDATARLGTAPRRRGESRCPVPLQVSTRDDGGHALDRGGRDDRAAAPRATTRWK
jgi:hypothetical protein